MTVQNKYFKQWIEFITFGIYELPGNRAISGHLLDEYYKHIVLRKNKVCDCIHK